MAMCLCYLCMVLLYTGHKHTIIVSFLRIIVIYYCHKLLLNCQFQLAANKNNTVGNNRTRHFITNAMCMCLCICTNCVRLSSLSYNQLRWCTKCNKIKLDKIYANISIGSNVENLVICVYNNTNYVRMYMYRYVYAFAFVSRALSV